MLRSSGKGIRFSLESSEMVQNLEVKIGKKNGLVGLMTIQGSDSHEILKVSMVTKYLSLVLCGGKIMSPFLECRANG